MVIDDKISNVRDALENCNLRVVKDKIIFLSILGILRSISYEIDGLKRITNV